jgi:spore germination protein GerM
MNKIIIIVRGGMVQHVLGNEGIQVDVLDYDNAEDDEDEFKRCEEVFETAKNELKPLY